MGAANQPTDLYTLIRDLRDEVAALRRGRSLNSAAVAMRDGLGNIAVAVDVTAGLARPYLPVPFYSAAAPSDSTTSASFVDLQIAKYRIQHRRLTVVVLAAASDGSTSGEVRVVVGGAALDAVRAVPAGTSAIVTFGPAPLPVAYAHEAFVDITVQARRTAGAGTVGVRVLGAYGEQS